ncbi:MAG: amidohydrolase family protein [Pseudomonadota bacterium]
MLRLIVLGAVALLPQLLIAQESLRPEQPVAFVGGMLLDGYEAEPIHHATVLVEGNRIIAVGPRDSVELPPNTVTIDIAGKTLLPGLIDAHVHIDLIGHGDYDRYYKFLRGTERLHDVMPIAAKQMLRAGVTSAIDLGTPLQILEFRERIRRGELPGPRLTVSGPWITRVYLAGVPDGYQLLVDSPREAAARARELLDAGVDVIKTWVGLTEADYRAVVNEAHARGAKVHAHLYNPNAIRAALAADVDVLQHVGSARNPPYDDELVSRIAHARVPIVQTISHRIWVYPATVGFPERLGDPIHAKDMPADIYREVVESFDNFHRLSYFHDIGDETRNARRSAGQFIAAGAYMGVGTDAASPLNFHNEAMWFEIRALVESGMTPIQVISAATKTNAEILGQFEDLGTVEPGKLADLIVVDGNPLYDIDALSRVDIVMKDGGVWYAERAAHGRVVDIGHAF